MAKLAEKSAKVLAYLQANDKGDGVAISEIAAAFECEDKNIRPVITLSLGKEPKDGSRGILATYEKREIEGVEKPVGYAVLTDAGKGYVDVE